MDMERKDVIAEIKELDEKGEGVLRFIRFNQEDKDADITLPGFVGRQKAVLLAAHNWKSDYPPLGHGESFESDGATNFRFRLNLSDERAKAWHAWLKMDRETGLQQVSYGFSPYPDGVERAKKDGREIRYLKPRPDNSPGAKLHEVSFVVVGSGNDTAVVDIKENRGMQTPEGTAVKTHGVAISPEGSSTTSYVVAAHKTDTSDSPWDVLMHQRRVKGQAPAGYYRQLYAAGDLPEQESRSGFRFLHHLVDVDGTPGPASTRACLQQIAVLHGTTVPLAERKAIYDHLASHLREAGREPPEFRGVEHPGYPLEESMELALWELEAILMRVDGIRDLRALKGRGLSDRILKQLDRAQQTMGTLCSLVHIKSLDKPSDVILAELSAEARHDVWQRRIEDMQQKVKQDAQRHEDAAIEERVKRWQQLQQRLQGS